MSKIEIGDKVWTKHQMLFVEATNPHTGKDIEVCFPKRHELTIAGYNTRDGTVDVALPDGFVATLDRGSVETIDD